MDDQEFVGLTRRDALKRGAKLGGAVLWMTPVVQAIGMRPAFAQTTSPTCASCCVKIDAGGCDGINPNNTCFDPAPPQDEACCDHISSTVQNTEFCWTVTLREGCTFGDGPFSVTSGGDCDPNPGVTVSADRTQVTLCNVNIKNQNGQLQAISHVEVCFECCS